MTVQRARIVRWLDGPRWKSPFPIWAGDPPHPVAPDWALIARFEESRSSAQTFVLEFMPDNGRVLAHFQFDALEITIDEAFDLAGIARNEWLVCEVAVPEEGDYPPRAVLRQAG